MSKIAIRSSLVALLGAMLTPAATLRSLVNEGNERYESKEYEDATKAYRLAAEQAPDSHHAHFNLGAALYRTGEYTQAIGAFQHAAQMARENRDAKGEALSRYNLGNSFFRSSEADAQTNPRQAIAALEHSVESYRQALQLDPKLADAAHNIALARRRMKELLDQMRNTPPSGGSQQDQEQLQDQIEQNLSRQKELSDKREELEQQQKDQRGQDLQQDAEKLAQEQQQLEQQSRDLAKQLDKPDATPEQQRARENLEKAAQEQQQASEQIGQQQMQQAESSQGQAQRSLENALAALGRDPRNAEPSPQPQQPGDSQQQPQQRLQALEQSPQDILNEERTNRKRRRMLMMGSQAQVEKDW